MTVKGKFIVLEGIDGSGISTQTLLLQQWMHENEQSFRKTYFTKEPTDGPVGNIIRLALAKRLKPLDERVMALLFAADRLDHLFCSGNDQQKDGLLKLLDNGTNVVSDRYLLSSFAYQSIGVDLDWVREINKFSPMPDLTILLLVSAEKSAQRREKSRIHEELYEHKSCIANIRMQYEKIAQMLRSEGQNILIIDAERERENIFIEIRQAVKNLFADNRQDK